MNITQGKKVITKDADGNENGWLFELLKSEDGVETKAYLTSVFYKTFKGFHLHRKRVANYVCLRGSVKITLYSLVDGKWVVDEEIMKAGDKLTIPINVATGILGLEDESWLVNFPEPAYDPNDKEEQVEYSLEELNNNTVK